MKNIEYFDSGIFMLFCSVLISLVLCWLSLKIAPIIKLMDDPKTADHKKHKKPIPITGGLVIVDTILILMLFTNLWLDTNIFAIIISSFLIAGLGLLTII